MRYGGLADADERGDVADAQLAGRQRVEDAHPRRIAEDAKRVGQRLDRVRGHQQTASASLGARWTAAYESCLALSATCTLPLVGTEATA